MSKIVYNITWVCAKTKADFHWISFIILIEGFAKYRILKTGAVPTIGTDSIGNVELSAQRTARIEKRENVKIVNSLLNKSHAEDDAQRQQKVEENKTADENLGCFDASETCIENVQYNSNTGDEFLTTLKFEM